jgi:uncharacterized protein (DUF1778 family)
MQALVGRNVMARKKSETRRHTAMVRIEADALERAKLAASLMKTTVSDYVTDLVTKAAEKDISREAKKLAGGAQ